MPTCETPLTLKDSKAGNLPLHSIQNAPSIPSIGRNPVHQTRPPGDSSVLRYARAAGRPDLTVLYLKQMTSDSLLYKVSVPPVSPLLRPGVAGSFGFQEAPASQAPQHQFENCRPSINDTKADVKPFETLQRTWGAAHLTTFTWPLWAAKCTGVAPFFIGFSCMLTGQTNPRTSESITNRQS